MGLFSKVKKAFKKVASILVSVVESAVSVVAPILEAAVKLIAAIEEKVNALAEDFVESVNVGPFRSLTSKLTRALSDGFLAASKATLGVALLTLGAITNNKALRSEGRLELMTAALYFMRAISVMPSWLLSAIMILISFFFPPVGFIIMAVMAAVYALVRYEVPKVDSDPDALLRRLILLGKYGLLDDETTALLRQYVALTKSESYWYDESNVRSSDLDGHSEYVIVDPGPVIEAIRDTIRDLLTNVDEDDQGNIDTGGTKPPSSPRSSSSAALIGALLVASFVALLMGGSR